MRGLPRRAALDAATVQVLAALEAAGVEPLLLKGPALVRMLYRPDEHRGYSDIDLLVAPAELDGARRALAGGGWESSSDYLGIDDVAGVVEAEVWFRPAGRGPSAQVDLHWRLPGWEAPAHVAWDALRARPASIELEGRAVAVLDRTGLALHVATHAAQHGRADVKALADLSRAVERWDDGVWRSAAALAEEVGATPALAAGLRLVPGGAELAEHLGLPATDRLSWALANRADRPRGTFHLAALAEAQGVRGRARVLRRALLPHRRWVIAQYPWARDGGVRLAAAYVAHLLRSPAWAMRAWRYRRRERRAGS